MRFMYQVYYTIVRATGRKMRSISQFTTAVIISPYPLSDTVIIRSARNVEISINNKVIHERADWLDSYIFPFHILSERDIHAFITGWFLGCRRVTPFEFDWTIDNEGAM